MNFPLKTGLLLAAGLLSCGCSTVRFAYDNADAYVRWKLGGYLSVQGEDADWLDERIDEFHEWHRRNELPKYAKFAREAAQRFGDGLSREDMVWGYDAVMLQARESLRKAVELLAPLLDRLDAEQIRDMERGIAEENRRFHKEYLRGSEQERRQRRAKYAVEQLEDWVGKLSKAQVERVRVFAERAPLLDEMRERDRRRLQADVMAIIRSRQAQARLAERIVNWERGRDPAYTAGIEVWQGEAYAMLADVDRSLTPQQRLRMQRNLRRYAEEFETLAAR